MMMSKTPPTTASTALPNMALETPELETPDVAAMIKEHDNIATACYSDLKSRCFFFFSSLYTDLVWSGQNVYVWVLMNGLG